MRRVWAGNKVSYAVSQSSGTWFDRPGLLYGWYGQTPGTFAIKDGANQLAVFTVSAGVWVDLPGIRMLQHCSVSASSGVALAFYLPRDVTDPTIPAPDFGVDFSDLGSGIANITPFAGTATPTFTRATTAWTTGPVGTGFVAVASGSPRSYYSPEGIYKGVLIEASRINLVLQSQNFNATWAPIGTPQIAGGTTTYGALSLDFIQDDDGAVLEGFSQTVTFTGNAAKAISFFIRQGTSTSTVIRLRDTTAPADRLLAAITWSSGVPVVTMTTGTDLTGTPQQYGTTGIYRILLQTTSVTAANTNSLQVYPATDAALATTSTGDVEIGGVQAENGTFPSSYMISTTSNFTRNADSLTYTTGDISLGTQDGTFFIQYQNLDVQDIGRKYSFTFTSAVGNNRLEVRSDNDSTAGQVVVAYGTGSGVQTVTVGTVDVRIDQKLAFCYGLQGVSGSLNGATAVTNTAASDFSTQAAIGIGAATAGGQEHFGPIRKILHWRKRLDSKLLKLAG